MPWYYLINISMDDLNSTRELYLADKNTNKNTVDGYTVPKTCLYISKEFSFPKSNPKNTKKKLINFPDPAKYSDTIEASEKKYWFNSSGYFIKDKKDTLISRSLKSLMHNPGPGHYFQKLPDKKQTNQILGKFDKQQRITFFSNVEAFSEDTPSSWDYTPFPFDVKKVPGGLYQPPYFKPNRKYRSWQL
jgi:hypothetical protein